MSEYRKAVFVVVYSMQNNKLEYIVLKRKLHWRGWEFPKVGIEGNENEEETARRGVKEETGLDIKGPIKKFNVYGKYKYAKKLPDSTRSYRTNIFLICTVDKLSKGKVKLDQHEHSTSEWLGFKEAFDRITQKDQKGMLRNC